VFILRRICTFSTQTQLGPARWVFWILNSVKKSLWRRTTNGHPNQAPNAFLTIIIYIYLQYMLFWIRHTKDNEDGGGTTATKAAAAAATTPTTNS
jgi:hypothetical protein